MSQLIYLRPLRIKDAQISYKWRNNPLIWTYTNFVPSEHITSQIEKKWLRDVLSRKHDKRFAICVNETDEYIGNVQLRNIDKGIAEFEIFIGENKYWGKGVGHEATKQILQIAFVELKLATVFLNVHPDNITAIRCYSRSGFKFLSQNEHIKMIATASTFAQSIA